MEPREYQNFFGISVHSLVNVKSLIPIGSYILKVKCLSTFLNLMIQVLNFHEVSDFFSFLHLVCSTH